jgi:PLP dependent protein
VNIAENLSKVRAGIDRAGRDPAEITIVAVTKGFGADVCRAALSAGLTILGENRVQEAQAKMAEVEGATWHLIGHLQSNKVKLAAGRFALIQTLDSLHLA